MEEFAGPERSSSNMELVRQVAEPAGQNSGIWRSFLDKALRIRVFLVALMTYAIAEAIFILVIVCISVTRQESCESSIVLWTSLASCAVLDIFFVPGQIRDYLKRGFVPEYVQDLFLSAILTMFFVLFTVLFALFSQSCPVKAPWLYFTTILATFRLIVCTSIIIVVFLIFKCRGGRTDTEPNIPREAEQELQLHADVIVRSFRRQRTSAHAGDSDIFSIDGEDASCTICLSEYTDGSQVKRLACRHHFHASCIDEWLRTRATCPLCVRSVDDQTCRVFVNI
jgi:hypothetical protein